MTGGILYHKGEEVPTTATYMCVPCGYENQLDQGDTFPECVSCLAGTDDGPEEYADGRELWEKLEAEEEEEE